MNAMKKALLPLVALLVACGGSDGPDTTGKAEGADLSAVEMTGRITAMEDSLFAKPFFDAKGAQALLDVYKAFVRKHPLDTISPEYLFRGAGVAKALGRPEEGLQLYDRIIKEYPSWDRIVDTHYMKAFTLDADLDRKGEAETAYREVIDRYPDHPFARDAQAMIDNLPYTDEELIERFRKMNEEQAAAD